MYDCTVLMIVKIINIKKSDILPPNLYLYYSCFMFDYMQVETITETYFIPGVLKAVKI